MLRLLRRFFRENIRDEEPSIGHDKARPPLLIFLFALVKALFGGMKGRPMKVITALLLVRVIEQGWGAEISRISSNPVTAFQGSDATFQWILGENLTSLSDFKGLVFGLWRNGYVATYITTVTRNEQVIPNPDLKVEAPRFDGRVHWKGDLSKSLAVFKISDVSPQDQMNYGLLLNFGPFRHSPSDSVRLQVEGKSSMVKALPSLPIPAKQGRNITFHCEFHVSEEDEAVYEGSTVGVWERGGIVLTLMTVTKEHIIVRNPKLYLEGWEYSQRVHGQLSTNTTNNTSKLLVELVDVRETDERSYGCSMNFGPFREPLGKSVSVDVEGTSGSNKKLSFVTNYTHDTREVRVGKDIMISCPVLSEVIRLDQTFKSLSWSYCTSKTCTTAKTSWSWMAGMNNQRVRKVTHKGPYEGRVNLTRNGTLMLSSVQISDGTDYRCTVQRVNFTSPRVYFFTLTVNATEPPRITNTSGHEVTVVEGNALLLLCEAVGFPSPNITWSKNGKLLPNSDDETKFIIHKTNKEDAGTYRCEASNSVGKADYTWRVKIKSKGDDGKTWTPLTIALLSISVCLVLVIAACCACRRRHAGNQSRYENV